VDREATRGVPLFYSIGNASDNMIDVHPERPMLKKPFRYEELVEMLTRMVPQIARRHWNHERSMAAVHTLANQSKP
jgi:hypothetical protein